MRGTNQKVLCKARANQAWLGVTRARRSFESK